MSYSRLSIWPDWDSRPSSGRCFHQLPVNITVKNWVEMILNCFSADMICNLVLILNHLQGVLKWDLKIYWFPNSKSNKNTTKTLSSEPKLVRLKNKAALKCVRKRYFIEIFRLWCWKRCDSRSCRAKVLITTAVGTAVKVLDTGCSSWRCLFGPAITEGR